MADRSQIKEQGSVEDRRGSQTMMRAGGIGLIGVVLVLAIGYFNGPEQALQLLQDIQNNTEMTQPQSSQQSTEYAGEDDYEIFASKIIGSTNTLWGKAFQESKREYQTPKLVLFRGSTQSACGGALSQVGPHYCPGDQTIYLDETFFQELSDKFGAQGGDLAQAYVLAHEVGHHVQNLLGITDTIDQNSMRGGGNEYSIKLELQADCLAGIRIGSINQKGILEANDLYEAIDAAQTVGDDHIQETTAGYTQPETRTHGSSTQRKEWLMKGYTTQSFEACNTFE